MTLEEILKVTGGTFYGKKKRKKNFSFSIDTRTLKKEEIFIALSGPNYDGHEYLKEAEEKGARYAIVEKLPKRKFSKMGLIFVLDTKEALFSLAIYKRNQFKGTVIAITGSVGKTTCKELLFHVLTPTYKVLKSEKNKNNELGLSLTLLNLNPNIDILVTELGMNHKGEIEKLSKMCKPDISILTNIGSSHIGNFASKKEIFDAKLEILKGMNNGTIYVNQNDSYLRHLKIKNQKIKKVKPVKLKKIDFSGIHFLFSYKKKKYPIFFQNPGYHYLELVPLVFSVGNDLNIPIETMINRLKDIPFVPHRMEVQKLKKEIFLIDDSYNASLESFTSAYSLLKKEKRPKLLILGSILEAGDYSNEIHQKILKMCNKMKHTEVWMIGSTWKDLYHKCYQGTYFESLKEMKECILHNDWENAILYVKGSHNLHLEEICEIIKEKYS